MLNRHVTQMRLGEDDIALGVECGLVDREFARDLAHQHQRCIDRRRIVLGHVERIDGLGRRGERVGVGTEGEAKALQHLLGVPRCLKKKTAEYHVLEDMRDAFLVVAFHQRAGIDPEAKRYAALRRRVALDRIAHAVWERAEANRSVRRQVAGGLRPGPRWRRIRQRWYRKDKKD